MNVTLLILFLVSNSYSYNCDKPYSIKIWDANYSLAYTNLYTITGKNIAIKRISGVKGEKDTLLLKRDLNGKECKLILDFLEQHKMDTLKSNYSNPDISDGNRKTVIIEINGKVKKIRIAAFYQKEIGALFSIINEIIVNKDLKLKYKQPTWMFTGNSQ